jgi:site-specific recombinase XerD
VNAATVERPGDRFERDEAEPAAASFLARYSGRTLEYRHDLRGFFQWAADNHLELLKATRPHIELFRAGMEDRQLAASTIPLVPRTARTIDLNIGEHHDGPILRRRDGQRLDRRTAHRWVHSIGRRAGLGSVHPHMLRAAFIMAALDAGVPLRDVQLAARHADPRTTTIYDHRRQNFDRHAAYVVVAFVAFVAVVAGG